MTGDVRDEKRRIETTGTRCEIQELYFWLGEEAERVGFTPWRAVWLGYPTMMIGASDGRPYRLNDYGLWEHADAD